LVQKGLPPAIVAPLLSGVILLALCFRAIADLRTMICVSLLKRWDWGKASEFLEALDGTRLAVYRAGH
jgi:hypothetical protein